MSSNRPRSLSVTPLPFFDEVSQRITLPQLRRRSSTSNLPFESSFQGLSISHSDPGRIRSEVAREVETPSFRSQEQRSTQLPPPSQPDITSHNASGNNAKESRKLPPLPSAQPPSRPLVVAPLRAPSFPPSSTVSDAALRPLNSGIATSRIIAPLRPIRPHPRRGPPVHPARSGRSSADLMPPPPLPERLTRPTHERGPSHPYSEASTSSTPLFSREPSPSRRGRDRTRAPFPLEVPICPPLPGPQPISTVFRPASRSPRRPPPSPRYRPQSPPPPSSPTFCPPSPRPRPRPKSPSFRPRSPEPPKEFVPAFRYVRRPPFNLDEELIDPNDALIFFPPPPPVGISAPEWPPKPPTAFVIVGLGIVAHLRKHANLGIPTTGVAYKMVWNPEYKREGRQPAVEQGRGCEGTSTPRAAPIASTSSAFPLRS